VKVFVRIEITHSQKSYFFSKPPQNQDPKTLSIQVPLAALLACYTTSQSTKTGVPRLINLALSRDSAESEDLGTTP